MLISTVACSCRRMKLFRPVPVVHTPTLRLLRRLLPRMYPPIPTRVVLCRKLGAVLHCRGTVGRDATMHPGLAACDGRRVRPPSRKTGIHRSKPGPRLSADRRPELSPCTRHTCAPADESPPNRCSRHAGAWRSFPNHRPLYRCIAPISAFRLYPLVDSGATAASLRISMRQPVSLAASRAFWPSLPIASESW